MDVKYNISAEKKKVSGLRTCVRIRLCSLNKTLNKGIKRRGDIRGACVARKGKLGNVYKILIYKAEQKIELIGIDVCERIIKKLIQKGTCDNVVFVSPDETEASGGLFNQF
jgi:hypothetical protein